MKKFDWSNILKSWQSATSSTFASRRGKNEPTVLKIDELLEKYMQASKTSQPAQLAALQDLCFTLAGWLGRYDGSRAEAAQQLLEDAQARRTELKTLGTAQDLAHWPKQPMPAIGAAPLHVAMNKFPGDKYFTLGMQVEGGLGKDSNNQALRSNRKHNEENPAAWKGLVYMNERERVRFLVNVRGGLLHHATPDKVMDTGKSHITTKKVGNGMYIFVMDGNGRIFSAAKDDVEHHSSFLAGNPCGAAGTFKVTAGKVGYVTNQSGHYCPTKDYIDQFVTELTSRGADVSGLDLAKQMGTRAGAQAASARRGITLGLRLYPSGPRNEGC